MSCEGHTHHRCQVIQAGADALTTGRDCVLSPGSTQRGIPVSAMSLVFPAQNPVALGLGTVQGTIDVMPGAWFPSPSTESH